MHHPISLASTSPRLALWLALASVAIWPAAPLAVAAPDEATTAPSSAPAPAAPGSAASAGSSAALEERIRLLEERLRAREAKEEGTTSAPSGAASTVVPTEKADERPWFERIELHGFVDVYAAWNDNRPGDGAAEESFIPGTGSTGKRANAFDLNLAAVDLSLTPDPVGFHLAIVYGTGTQVLHLGEPRGDGDLDEVSVYDLLYRAQVGVKLPIGTGLLVEAGIFPSPIGFEGFYSKDNFNYTRAWVGELSPYYLCGASVGYRFHDLVAAKVFVVNGWQIVSENNRAKSFAAQITLGGDALALTWTGFAGPEQADNTSDWRLFSDVVITAKPTDWLALAAQIDLGQEERSGAKDPLWHGYAAFARVTPVDWLSVGLRGEIFRDPENGISGFRTTLWEVTGTLELRPMDHLSVKLEARHDGASTRVYAGPDTETGGPRLRDQTTLYAAVVVSF